MMTWEPRSDRTARKRSIPEISWMQYSGSENWSVCSSPKKISSKTVFHLRRRRKSEGEGKKFFRQNFFRRRGTQSFSKDYKDRLQVMEKSCRTVLYHQPGWDQCRELVCRQSNIGCVYKNDLVLSLLDLEKSVGE